MFVQREIPGNLMLNVDGCEYKGCFRDHALLTMLEYIYPGNRFWRVVWSAIVVTGGQMAVVSGQGNGG